MNRLTHLSLDSPHSLVYSPGITYTQSLSQALLLGESKLRKSVINKASYPDPPNKTPAFLSGHFCGVNTPNHA
jgi:hypothetical protein